MADVKVIIEVNPNVETELLGNIKNSNANIVNTSIKLDSNGQFVNVPTANFDGSNGIVWNTDFINSNGKEDNYLVFNSNDELDNVENTGAYLESENNPNEFVWGLVPESKEYSVKLTFSGASNLKDIVVFGDKVNNQFPTEAIIDGTTTIYSDDYQWTINLAQESDTHTIEFTKWNRANYNACLTLIRVMLRYFQVDKLNGLKSVESLLQSTAQPKEIVYGSTSGVGNIELIDINRELEELIEQNIIGNDPLKINVIIKDTCIRTHYLNESSFDGHSKVLDVELVDVLSNWDNIIVKANKNYDNYAYTILKTTLEKIVNPLSQKFYTSKEIDAMCSEELVYYGTNVGTVKDYLSLIYIHNAYNEEQTLREFVNNICSVAQLNLLQLSDGNLRFVSARPRKTNNDKTISIPLKNQMSVLDRNLLLKNKYSGVLYEENSLVESLEEVLSEEYTFKDKDGSLDLSAIGDNAKIITDRDGLQYLCFIKNISTGHRLVRFNNIYDTYNVHPVQFTISDYDETTSGTGRSVGFAYSNSLKEDYNFSLYAPATILSQYSTLNSETIAFKILLEDVDSAKLKVRIFGRCFNIKTKNVLYGGSQNPYRLTLSNEFLKKDTKFMDFNNSADINIYNLIVDNITTDYSDGIIAGKITVNCTDYYDTSGNLVKNWAKGEIIQVGDIIQIDKNNNGSSLMQYRNGTDMCFRVVGSNFRYEGIPLIDLEVQQISNTTIVDKTYIPIYLMIGGERHVEYVSYGGNLVISDPERDGYDFLGWSLDGQTIVEIETENITESKTYFAIFGHYDTEIANSLVGTMVENGKLMFNNFDNVFVDSGYRVDWDKSNLSYYLKAWLLTDTHKYGETSVFALNKLTYGTTIDISNLTFNVTNTSTYMKSYGKCSVEIGDDYSVKFVDEEFYIKVDVSMVDIPCEYEISLHTSSIYIISQ